MSIRLALALAVAVTSAAACEAPPERAEPTTSLVVSVGPKTTDGDIAARNLSAKIDGLEAALVLAPERQDVRGPLIGSLIARAQFFGTWHDFDRALELSDAWLTAAPASLEATRARIHSLMAVHRFADARTVLEAFEHPEKLATERTTLDELTVRDPEQTAQTRAAAAAADPSFDTLFAWAHVLARQGQFDRADAVYREAANAYRDTSPMPIAKVAFARGLMWSEVAGQQALGETLYREAVRRLPGYVQARVHLAEIVASRDKDGAIALLQALPRAEVVDPEPTATLGELADNPELIDEAANGYNTLLERLPEAVWDHAAEFFTGVGGDPPRALELALKSYAARPTERTLLIAMHAAVAAGDFEELKRLRDTAPDPVVTVPLAQLLAVM